jgi:hypothetical protein
MASMGEVNRVSFFDDLDRGSRSDVLRADTELVHGTEVILWLADRSRLQFLSGCLFMGMQFSSQSRYSILALNSGA